MFQKTKQQVGKEGEDKALAYLETKGYWFRAANYRTRWGEIDLVFETETHLVFVEVKHRRSDEYGEPEEAITANKKKHMVRCALAYLGETNSWGKSVRFDIVSVGPRGVRHFENAFDVEGKYYY